VPRAAGIVLAVAVPPTWFVIDWFGARQFFRSAGAATQQSQGGPLLSREPGIATFRETWHLMSAPVIVLFVLGFAVALLRSRRDRRLTPAAWLGLAAIAWLVIDALLAQGRFATGAPRYLLPGGALACVVAGLFAADLARLLARRLPAPRLAAATVAVGCLALAGCAVPRLVTTGQQVHRGILAGRAAAGCPDDRGPPRRWPRCGDRVRTGHHQELPGAAGRVDAAHAGRHRGLPADRPGHRVSAAAPTAGCRTSTRQLSLRGHRRPARRALDRPVELLTG
jgi:hypothetical protein